MQTTGSYKLCMLNLYEHFDIFIFFFQVWMQLREWSILTNLFFDFTFRYRTLLSTVPAHVYSSVRTSARQVWYTLVVLVVQRCCMDPCLWIVFMPCVYMQWRVWPLLTVLIFFSIWCSPDTVPAARHATQRSGQHGQGQSIVVGNAQFAESVGAHFGRGFEGIRRCRGRGRCGVHVGAKGGTIATTSETSKSETQGKKKLTINKDLG